MPWTEFVANSYFALQIAIQNVTMSDLYVIKTAIFETRPPPPVLRVEFLLKTESGYLRGAEVTWFTLANP